MSIKSVVRFVSGVTALSGATILTVDRSFEIAYPTLRGTALYVGFQILSQVMLINLMVRRIIVIYC